MYDGLLSDQRLIPLMPAQIIIWLTHLQVALRGLLKFMEGSGANI